MFYFYNGDINQGLSLVIVDEIITKAMSFNRGPEYSKPQALGFYCKNENKRRRVLYISVLKSRGCSLSERKRRK